MCRPYGVREQHPVDLNAEAQRPLRAAEPNDYHFVSAAASCVEISALSAFLAFLAFVGLRRVG
jgi:hypothetical protein